MLFLTCVILAKYKIIPMPRFMNRIMHISFRLPYKLAFFGILFLIVIFLYNNYDNPIVYSESDSLTNKRHSFIEYH